MSSDRPVNRRDFFKYAFVEITKAVQEFSGEKRDLPPRKRNYLRPPGAVGEALFDLLCTRCDACIKACPHQCIRGSDSEEGGAKVGTPIIIPKEAACRLCSDLPCIKACKDGALRPVEDIRKVRIGVALIDRRSCIDYMEEQAPPCRQCYIQCPLKDEAIYLDRERPVIRAERCTGCGICENICRNVNPSPAIRVFPVPAGL